MPRKVRVCGAAFSPYGGGPWTVEANRQRALDLLDRAALSRPDVVALPEVFLTTNAPYEKAREAAEPVPGPTTDALAAKAREHGCYVICPLFEDAEEQVYNTAAILDRQGQVVGTYRKIHPTLGELESGVSPGWEATVFDLDFGRVGATICFDLYYPHVAAELAGNGAEILFWCSVYEGGFPLWARAYDHSVFVVSAQRRMRNFVINQVGRTVAECGIYDGIVFADLDLDTQVFCTDDNMRKLDSLRARYGADAMAELYAPEGVFTLQSKREDLPVDRLVEEFELERLHDYLRRSAEALSEL